jgi:hypothetical protein
MVLTGQEAPQEKSLRSKLAGFTVLETRKDGTKFTSTAMKGHADALNTASRQYAEAQRSLIDSVRTTP